MLKKTIALAAGLSLLTGCITSSEFANLSKTLTKGTLLIRSLTVSDPTTGNTNVTNFLGWISMSGGTPSELTRNGDKVPGSDGQLGSNFYRDENGKPVGNTLNPGQRYVYALNFGESVATQSIVPSLLPDTRLTSVSPQGTNAATAGSQPMLTWTKVGATPKGYIVTVAEMAGGFAGSSLSGGKPVYLAFLDAAAHTTSVKYGTPSDLAAITGDDLLSGFLAENEFFKPVNEALESGKTYAWTVVAIDHDTAKTSFAIDKPDSLGIFTVQ